MIPDLDIYRTASVLIKQHGEDAPIHAAMRADATLETGDVDGYATWKRILRAVEEMQGTEPGARVALSPGLAAGIFICVDTRMSVAGGRADLPAACPNFRL